MSRLIADLKNHLKWYGNTYAIKTVYMVSRDECIKIRFHGTFIREIIEYIERLQADGFRISCWTYWVMKKWWLWFRRNTNKTTVQSKNGINVVIEDAHEDLNSTSLGTGMGR